MLSAKFAPIIRRIIATPQILKLKCPEMEKRLQGQGKADSEGTGNKVTNHEAAFATVLEEFGFTWLPKNKKNDHLRDLPTEGFYYIYQANGSQAAVDFEVFRVADRQIKESYKIDCKHSNNEIAMLNDGWFDKDTLYVMTWTAKKVVKGLVAFGSTFTTKEDDKMYKETRRIIADLNSQPKKGANFSRYFRCANQFHLKTFTDDFIQSCTEATFDIMGPAPPPKKFQFKRSTSPVVAPTPPQSPAAPHSPPGQSAPS